MSSVKLREKKLKEGRSFYLDIYHNGKRSYEFIGVKVLGKMSSDEKKEKRELAKTIRSQRELEIVSAGTAYTPKHKKNIDFIAFYREYLANYPKKDIRMIRYSMEKFIAFIGKQELLVSELDTKLCEGYRDYLKNPEKGLTGETPQNYFARFKKVVKAARKEGILMNNPVEDVIFKSSDTDKLKKEILTADELRKLNKTQASNDTIKRAFLFCCYTGLGLAEIRQLRWYNIHNNRLKINRAKTGTEINIPINKSAMELIGKRKRAGELIFDIEVSDKSVDKTLKSLIKKAEIEKNISFYCGRHTYAVQLLLNGANLKTVSDCMGHKNTRHTIKYLNYVDSLKDKAIENLPEL